MYFIYLLIGASIEQGSSTPLMEAAQEGHVDLVKFLLEQGIVLALLFEMKYGNMYLLAEWEGQTGKYLA